MVERYEMDRDGGLYERMDGNLVFYEEFRLLEQRIAELEAERGNLRAESEASRIGWDRLGQALRDAGHWDGESIVNFGQRAREVIAEIGAERGWVPVSERLPEPHVRVMVAVNDGKVLGMRPHPEMASVNEHGVWFWGSSASRVGQAITHWMAMPKMPGVTDGE